MFLYLLKRKMQHINIKGLMRKMCTVIKILTLLSQQVKVQLVEA